MHYHQFNDFMFANLNFVLILSLAQCELLISTKISSITTWSELRSALSFTYPQVLQWKCNSDDVSKLCQPQFEELLNHHSIENFDIEYSFRKDYDYNLDFFFQENPRFLEFNLTLLSADMKNLTDAMREVATPNDKIICRLAVVNGVRCPKWHEDYVDMRLIKSYFGQGTDWIDPNNQMIRFQNYIRSWFDMDLKVSDRNDIIHSNCGDVLIIPGRNRHRKIPGSVPVLHRSPITNISSKRLLFTVTLNSI